MARWRPITFVEPAQPWETMIHDAANLFNDLISGLAGLLSERTTFNDPGQMTWARWLWITALTLLFVACFAAARAFGQAISRLLGL